MVSYQCEVGGTPRGRVCKYHTIANASFYIAVVGLSRRKVPAPTQSQSPSTLTSEENVWWHIRIVLLDDDKSYLLVPVSH